MLNNNTLLPIEWQVTHKSLSQHDIDEWRKLINQSCNITSTNDIDFNLNALSMFSDLKPIFVLGYSTELLETTAKCKTLKSAFILVQKQKSILGMRFKLLQPVSHDHIDMMSILGDEYLNHSSSLSSLYKVLSQNIENWHMLSMRRLRTTKTFNAEMISPTYQRKSAYFDLKNDQNEIRELKTIIPKKLFKNIARFERKIEKERGASIELHTYTEQQSVNLALNDFFKLEANGWKGKAKSAIQSNPILENFYRTSWESFANDGFAKIYCLKLADEVIAAGIAFQTKDEIILHKIAFNEELSQYGPGSILVKQIMQDAINQNLVKSICFNTNPPWLKRWHPRLYNLVALQIFNNNFKGYLINFLFRTIDTLRKIKRKMK